MANPPAAAPPATENGSGMSRAAKKRAKKKHRKQQKGPDGAEAKRLKPTTHADDDDNNKLPAAQLKNDKDDDANDDAIYKDDEGEFLVPDEPDDHVDKVVEALISPLTPAQILLLKAVNDDEAQITVGTEEVDLRDLLVEVTAKQRAKCLFQSIIGMPLKEFYAEYYEKKPYLMQCNNNNQSKHRFDGFLSKESVKKLTETQPLQYAKDLNVTRYEQGVDGIKRRMTLDQVGDYANAADLWTNYDESGCTIRLLCPQEHSDATHSLLSVLELELGCMIGSNAYLTPPGAAQGFSPHYDDIDAYIMQLEGKKHWKVYAPLSKSETLPRESSNDYTEEDLKGIEPVLNVILEAGDLLYMPRGWIHQACTLPSSSREEHSLHLTVSAMQQWAWIDYLELLIPSALQACASSALSTSLRQGLPRNFLDYMGAVHDQPEDPEEIKAASASGAAVQDDDAMKRAQQVKARAFFQDEAKKRIMRVSKEAITMMDAACDQIGKRFLSDRLPPAMLTATEKAQTVEGKEENGGKIYPNTMCRLVRPGIARLVLEEDKAVLYHCADNSRVYQENPLSPLEFEMDDAPSLEGLLSTVEPHWIMVKDLIHDDIDDKIAVSQALFDEGILAIVQTEKPEK